MLTRSKNERHVETLLLALLDRQPNYGYRLVRDLRQLAPQLLRSGEGTVYPVLHRMEQQGLVTSQWQTVDGGRQRKYYHICRNGARQPSPGHCASDVAQRSVRFGFAGLASSRIRLSLGGATP